MRLPFKLVPVLLLLGSGCEVEEIEMDASAPPANLTRKIEITVARHVDQLAAAATSAEVDSALSTSNGHLCDVSPGVDADAKCQVQFSQRGDSSKQWGAAGDMADTVVGDGDGLGIAALNHASIVFVKRLRRCGDTINPSGCTYGGAARGSSLVVQTALTYPTVIMHEIAHQLVQFDHVGNCNADTLLCGVPFPQNAPAEFIVRNGICTGLLTGTLPAGAQTTLSSGGGCP